MQRGLKFITLQGAKEKSPILLSQYWKNEWLNGNIIISYLDGSNNIFADCMYITTNIEKIWEEYGDNTTPSTHDELKVGTNKMFRFF